LTFATTLAWPLCSRDPPYGAPIFSHRLGRPECCGFAGSLMDYTGFRFAQAAARLGFKIAAGVRTTCLSETHDR
jgi:hypothetical protein